MVIENVILLVGIALTLGFVIGKITHHFRLTAIVGYIVVGILLGPTFHIVELGYYEVNIIVSFTLGVVAFIIGGSFTIEFLKRLGKPSILITIIAATTVVFEIIGPIGVRYAVNRAGEAGSE